MSLHAVFGGASARDASAITLPVAGVNPMGYSYYGTALPFVDVAHMADRWLSFSSLPGGGSVANTQVSVQVNADDYPSSLAPGQIARTLIFANNGEIYPLGQYVLKWQGTGNVQLAGAGVSTVNSQAGQTVYSVTRKTGAGLYLDITSTDPANPVRNITLQSPLSNAAGSIFNPGYEKSIAGYGVLRFMGWNETNSTTVSTWSSRTTPATFHWGGSSGVPYESQIQLSNQLKQDLWINVPHLADDDYVSHLAQLVQQQLAPGLRVWVEYSNEVWNYGYPQAAYANTTLKARYGVATAAEAYGRRSAEIFEIFSGQVANPENRLVRIIAGQAANADILAKSLKGATIDGQLKADVAAVAPYFTVDTDQLYQQYLNGTVDLSTVFSELHDEIDRTMQWSSDNQRIAAANGLPLVSYEGGQHLVARPGAIHNNEGFVDLLSQINRDERMGSLYTYMLNEWQAIGGKTFTFAGDIGPAGKWGAWGLQESYLDVNAAKFKAVQRFLQGTAYTSPGDLNKDGATDMRDYDYWRAAFGDTQQLDADANNDGIVDIGDYIFLRKLLASQIAGGAALQLVVTIPEPSTAVLAIGALSMVLDVRRVQSR